MDKELGTLKEKLKWTEGQLQESQKKESQTQAKLTVLPLPYPPTHTLHTVLMQTLVSQGLHVLIIYELHSE